MRHPEPNLKGIKDSLQQFGQVEPLCVRRATREVIGGNGRLAVMRAMGWLECDAVFLDVDEPTAKALSLALNRTAQTAEWDMDKVSAMLRELEKTPLQIDKLGWDEKEIATLLLPKGGEVVDSPPQLDRAEELQKEWGTKSGDLWLVPSKTVPGKSQRILCGDSTKAEDVARVMGGEKAGLMNTDPPYGVAYANDERPHPGVAKPRVANDTLQDEELQVFLEAAFRAAKDHALLVNAAWYMWHAHLTQGYFAAAAAAAAAVVLHRQIIWVKPVLLLGRGQYHWKHEPCFMGWVKGNQPPDYGEGRGERTQTTVWEVGSVTQAERKEFNHSSPKPVGLFTIPIVKHLLPGEICYDPFLVSGPQLIGAEGLGRLCFGCDIEPNYVAVCLERCKAIGLSPHLSDSP